MDDNPIADPKDSNWVQESAQQVAEEGSSGMQPWRLLTALVARLTQRMKKTL